VQWATAQPRTVCLSDHAGRLGAAVSGAVEVPAFGIVTLRAER
jgi:hypothetical protein